MDSTAASLSDTKMAKAMAHPVRVKALAILGQRVASPSDIAAEIDLPIANVAYHVRALLQLGCIEEVETRPVRGALEHRYRAVRRTVTAPDAWRSMPASARQAVAASRAERAFADLAASMTAGTFEQRADRQVSFTELQLDEEGWAELNAKIAELREHAVGLQAACAARAADGAGGGAQVRSRLALLHFEAAPGDGDGH